MGNLCIETKIHNGSEKAQVVTIVNIYMDKKICKTKANIPRKMGKCYEYVIHRGANTNEHKHMKECSNLYVEKCKWKQKLDKYSQVLEWQKFKTSHAHY